MTFWTAMKLVLLSGIRNFTVFVQGWADEVGHMAYVTKVRIGSRVDDEWKSEQPPSEVRPPRGGLN